MEKDIAVIRWIVNAIGGYIRELDGYRNEDILIDLNILFAMAPKVIMLK